MIDGKLQLKHALAAKNVTIKATRCRDSRFAKARNHGRDDSIKYNK